MTCIAGLADRATGAVWLAGDSAGVAGLDLMVRSDRKVFRRGPFAIGYTTSFRMGQLVRYGAALPEPAVEPAPPDLFGWMVDTFVPDIRTRLKDGGFTEIENNREDGGCFLVGVRGRLFRVESDFQVGESAVGFDAVGCGAQVALGSLHATEGRPPEERLTRALLAAEAFSAGVRGPFHIVGAGG